MCVSKLTIIGSDNGLSPGRHQAIIWTNGGILLIWTVGCNSYILQENAIEHVWKMVAILSGPQCVEDTHSVHLIIGNIPYYSHSENIKTMLKYFSVEGKLFAYIGDELFPVSSKTKSVIKYSLLVLLSYIE